VEGAGPVRRRGAGSERSVLARALDEPVGRAAIPVGDVHHQPDRVVRHRLFFITGLIGGYTTFSAYAFESLAMWERGDRWTAAAYVVGSVLGGLLAVTVAAALARYVVPDVDEHALVAASGPGPGEEERV
jgi:CrcB-like protein, Camphor Resistance (CrcB)